MRIVKLTDESKTELLEILKKRNPVSLSEYENTVNDIISNVRENSSKKPEKKPDVVVRRKPKQQQVYQPGGITSIDQLD